MLNHYDLIIVKPNAILVHKLGVTDLRLLSERNVDIDELYQEYGSIQSKNYKVGSNWVVSFIAIHTQFQSSLKEAGEDILLRAP